MVHRGPAKGCWRCKDRHVRCDLARPRCQQCSRLGFDCPGYQHPVDIVLRDQTASIRARFQRPKPIEALRPLGNENQQALPRTTPVFLSLEARALSFLFSTTVLALDRDWRTTHGHFEVMVPLYQTVRSNSVLACAMSWYAVLMMGTCSGGKPYASENDLLNRAIKSVRRAVADPLKSLEDETLSAVMILQYGQYHFGRQHETKIPSTMHQDGAEALVRKRGRLNFKDDSALKLLAAVRNNAVNLALLGADRMTAWHLWEEQGERLGRSCTPILRLDAHAITLISLRHDIDRKCLPVHGSQPVDDMREKLLALLSHLSLWQHQVPREWWPMRKCRFLHYYRSQDVAYLFIQHYLLQLETLQLIQQLNVSVGMPDHSERQFNHSIELIQNIMAAENSLLTKDILLLDHRFETHGYQPSLKNEVSFPSVTVQQCRAVKRGAWLLDQVLIRLGNDLSRTLKAVELPSAILHQYYSFLDWTKQERLTVQRALTPWVS